MANPNKDTEGTPTRRNERTKQKETNEGETRTGEKDGRVDDTESSLWGRFVRQGKTGLNRGKRD